MGEVAVFVETNLGTRIAMTVSLDITSPDFKSNNALSLSLSSYLFPMLSLPIKFSLSIRFSGKKRKISSFSVFSKNEKFESSSYSDCFGPCVSKLNMHMPTLR